MTLQQFLRALRSRFRVFVVVLATVVLATLAASLLMPKTYRSTVSLLVDAKDQQSMGDALRVLGLPQEHLSYLQTQADILASPKVLHRAVEQLNLTQQPTALATLGLTELRSARLEDQVVDLLQHDLKVETSQSNVIRATVSSADPVLATAIANSIATAYVNTMLDLRVAPTRQAAAWFDEQLKGLRANLEEAQRRLRAEQQSAAQRLAQHPDRLPQARDDVYVQQLRADLARGEAHLRELSTQYGPNHPVYQRQVSENQQLRASIEDELRKVAAGVVDGDGYGNARRTAPRQPDPEQGRLEPVLQQDVESAQRAYDTAQQHYYASQVESRASETNVAVLSPAAVPLRAYRPNLELNLALALGTGLVLGFALVALLERQDGRVRSAEDLMVSMQLPLLAVLSNDPRHAGLIARPAAVTLPALPRPG